MDDFTFGDDATIVVTGDVDDRLTQICRGTALARARGAPLRHVLIYGKPGSGKSAVAKGLGESIFGLPYALMSGSDLAPLGKHGPEELRKILSWAKSQRSGAMLIIDEAEAALGRRHRNCSHSSSAREEGREGGEVGESYARDSLNVLLSMTGTASCELMLVLTTSNPQALDEAVLDRMDELVELKLPERPERRKILFNSFSKKFQTEEEASSASRGWLLRRKRRKFSRVILEGNFDVSAELDKLSTDKMTHGCSGRELEKMLQSVVTSVYANTIGNGKLDVQHWQRATRRYCQDLKMKWRLRRKDN